MKFRKKPVVIEAVQFLGLNSQEINDFIGADSWESCCSIGIDNNGKTSEVRIKTLEGTITANVNDWIIRGVKGELYPCKPDIFEAIYEPIKEPNE